MNAVISIPGKLKILTSGTFKCFFWLRTSSKTPTCIYQMKDEKIFETSMVADFRIFGHRNFCWCCKKSIAFRNSENMSCIQIGGPPKSLSVFQKKCFFLVQLVCLTKKFLVTTPLIVISVQNPQNSNFLVLGKFTHF